VKANVFSSNSVAQGRRIVAEDIAGGPRPKADGRGGSRPEVRSAGHPEKISSPAVT